MGGNYGRIRAKSLRVEHLEERCLLAATPLITEFMASNSGSLLDGDGGASDWVEIFNPTGAAINLSGWGLTDNDGSPYKWTFPNVTLNAGQYLVVFASNQLTPNHVDATGHLHTTYALSAGGEYLALVDPSGAVASEFAPEFPPQSADISYGLTATGQAVYFSHPTPGAANDDASAVTRGVVISEIMYHPSSELTTEEFIEIYNGEQAAVNLGGWTVAGGVDFTLPAYSLAPGQRLVVAANAAAFAAKYPTVTNVVGGWTGQLANSSETVQLRDNLGRQVDTVTYYDEGDWSTREVGPFDLNHTGWAWSNATDGGGSSLELVSPKVSNDWGQNWRASSVVNGTPGAPNSTADADANVAPLVLNVTQLPIIPRSIDPVTITARLVDELSVGLSATLFWRVDGAPIFTALAMTDNGSGADATAGDQVFSAQLPAMANGTVIEYYIRSQDQAGNQRAYPAPTQPSGQQLTNLLYQVDDTFNPAALPGPTDPPQYRLVMTEVERAELAHIGATTLEAKSHARMNGTFISVTSAGVEARYQVGIRNRGYGSADELPNSIHVDFARDALWHGLEAVNFNAQYTHLQLAGLKLAAAAGLVAEDTQVVRVRVNGADLSNPGVPTFGVYIQLEASDNPFVTNHFPDDDGGNLYRIVKDASDQAKGDLRDLGSDLNAYLPYYEKQTNASEADFSDVLELISVLNHASDAEYMAKVKQLVDVDQWLTYFATFAIIGSAETSLATGSGDDYIMYRGENDPRFVLIPHDFDSVLGQGQSISTPTSSIYRASVATSVAIARFFAQPEVRPAYHQKLKDLLATTFAKTSFDALLDQYLPSFAPAQRIADMKTYMDARRTYILGLVAAPLTATTSLTVANGFAKTTTNSAPLSGVAPLAGTRSVIARGVAATFDQTTGAWSLVGAPAGATPLRPGVNRIDVRAYDGPAGTGKLLASTFVDIWYDDASVVTAPATINTSVTWTAAGGPYLLTGDVTIVSPGVLTIEAGASVYFNSGTGITVNNGGRLVAEGTADAHIRFTRNPASSNTNWDGLAFTNTSADNRLKYVDIQAGDSAGQAVLVSSSTLTIDHVNWFNVTTQILDLVHPKLTVSNSVFPAISGDETVHLLGLNQGESLVFENNVFGVNSSTKDVVDLGHDTLTPPTIVFRGNTFLGGGDDGIDTDGFPVLIENNTFQNFHKTSTSGTTSNAVSTGHVTISGQTISSTLTLRNNTFINVDHGLLLKDFSFATAVNNTFVGATIAAIHFSEPTGNSVIGPGLGATLDGNIFSNNAVALLDFTAQTQLVVNRSILPAAFVDLGVGNLTADPLLVNPAGGDFSVKRGSPALGAGPNGSDIGAVQTPRYAPASAANLRITEVHFHPLNGNKPGGEVGGDDSEFEFIELQNTSGETIDLTDVTFTDGIDFTFPWLASLGSGQVIVLAGNRDIFQSRYGTSIPVAGEFAHNLSNSSDHLRLVGPSGEIADFTYADEAPWPAAADGGGPSFELNGPHASSIGGVNWHASVAAGGTPGVAFSLVINAADFSNDGKVDGFDFLSWQRGFGKTAPNAHIADGDADHDLDSDGADLAIFKSQFGVTTLATPSVVPEIAAAVVVPSDADFAPSALLSRDVVDVALAVAVDAYAAPGLRGAISQSLLREAFAAGRVLPRRVVLVAATSTASSADVDRRRHLGASDELGRSQDSTHDSLGAADDADDVTWDAAFRALLA